MQHASHPRRRRPRLAKRGRSADGGGELSEGRPHTAKTSDGGAFSAGEGEAGVWFPEGEGDGLGMGFHAKIVAAKTATEGLMELLEGGRQGGGGRAVRRRGKEQGQRARMRGRVERQGVLGVEGGWTRKGKREAEDGTWVLALSPQWQAVQVVAHAAPFSLAPRWEPVKTRHPAGDALKGKKVCLCDSEMGVWGGLVWVGNKVNAFDCSLM